MQPEPRGGARGPGPSKLGSIQLLGELRTALSATQNTQYTQNSFRPWTEARVPSRAERDLATISPAASVTAIRARTYRRSLPSAACQVRHAKWQCQRAAKPRSSTIRCESCRFGVCVCLRAMLASAVAMPLASASTGNRSTEVRTRGKTRLDDAAIARNRVHRRFDDRSPTSSNY